MKNKNVSLIAFVLSQLRQETHTTVLLCKSLCDTIASTIIDTENVIAFGVNTEFLLMLPTDKYSWRQSVVFAAPKIKSTSALKPGVLRIDRKKPTEASACRATLVLKIGEATQGQ